MFTSPRPPAPTLATPRSPASPSQRPRLASLSYLHESPLGLDPVVSVVPADSASFDSYPVRERRRSSQLLQAHIASAGRAGAVVEGGLGGAGTGGGSSVTGAATGAATSPAPAYSPAPAHTLASSHTPASAPSPASSHTLAPSHTAASSHTLAPSRPAPFQPPPSAAFASTTGWLTVVGRTGVSRVAVRQYSEPSVVPASVETSTHDLRGVGHWSWQNAAESASPLGPAPTASRASPAPIRSATVPTGAAPLPRPISRPSSSRPALTGSSIPSSIGTLRDGTPRDSARDGTPRDSTRDSTPRDSTRNSTPRDSTRDSTPRESTPRNIPPRQTPAVSTGDNSQPRHGPLNLPFSQSPPSTLSPLVSPHLVSPYIVSSHVVSPYIVSPHLVSQVVSGRGQSSRARPVESQPPADNSLYGIINTPLHLISVDPPLPPVPHTYSMYSDVNVAAQAPPGSLPPADPPATRAVVASGDTDAGASRGAALNGQLPSIRFVPHVDTRAVRPSLDFTPVSRTLATSGSVIRVGRYSERESAAEALAAPAGPTQASPAPVGFKSKVVSRRHCEFWFGQSQWFIKDVGSSSGTFLNHIRLSQPGAPSRPCALNDGDIVQLGIDFRGGEETIFRCVKMRVECNRGWQKGLNTFK